MHFSRSGPRHDPQTDQQFPSVSTILIPTSMVDSMNPVVALALAGKETEPQKANGPVPVYAENLDPRVMVMKSTQNRV
jgi:hypothetical protein